MTGIAWNVPTKNFEKYKGSQKGRETLGFKREIVSGDLCSEYDIGGPDKETPPVDRRRTHHRR